MHPVLLIPGLFPEIPDDVVPRLPCLELAMARGTLRFADSDAMLEGWPDAAGDPSLAFRLARDAGIAQEAPHWLRADPIHLQVEGDALLLLEHYSFSLTQEEADSLLDTLNRHFAGEGLRFFALSSDVWLAGLQEQPRIRTTHPLRRVGRNIAGHLPQGEDARRWRSLFNEVQMLFHDHPVNRAREARRERSISGVWFWDYPASTPGARVIDTLRAPSAYGDAAAWESAAHDLDGAVVNPLLSQLRAGSIDGFSLVAVEGRRAATLTLFRWQLWRWWRRPRPLVRLPGVPPLEHA